MPLFQVFRSSVIFMALAMTGLDFPQAWAGPRVQTTFAPNPVQQQGAPIPSAGQPVARLLEDILVLESAHALAGPPTQASLEQGVRTFVRSIDPYGDYLRPDVLASLTSTESAAYGGVGMEVLLDRDGRFICIPQVGSPASRAGVIYGQELLAVGEHLAAMSGVEDLGYLLRGEPGTSVILTMADPVTRVPRQVAVVRSVVPSVTVSNLETGSLPGVRISRFTRNTPNELVTVLGKMDLSRGLVIDLRGNVGGDFHASVKAAEMFLESGMVICSQRSRQGDKIFRSAGRRFHPRKIVLWQDHLSASASEVFLAAIAENLMGVSVGQPSYGKGASQAMFELPRGGALLVTTAKLVTPRGTAYDGIGLAPRYRLKSDPASPDTPFRDMTREIANGLN